MCPQCCLIYFSNRAYNRKILITISVDFGLRGARAPSPIGYATVYITTQSGVYWAIRQLCIPSASVKIY